jgi:hypothetical protein
VPATCGFGRLRGWVVAMDELSAQRDPEDHDADAPLTRDHANWFARELSDEWQAVEPGIYRHVGTTTGGLDAQEASDDRPASEDS